MLIKFGDKIIGEIQSFEIVDKEYPKVVDLNLKDGYYFCPGEQHINFPIITVKIHGEVVGSNNNDK